MKRISVILINLIALLFPIICSAQELKVKSMEIQPTDLSARTYSRADKNGDLCALLKIYVKDEITEVQGNIAGEIIDKGIEKWIYVSDHTKQIQLNFKDHFPLMIVFEDYNYATVSEKMTYVIKLVDENDNTAEVTTASRNMASSTPSARTVIRENTSRSRGIGPLREGQNVMDGIFYYNGGKYGFILTLNVSNGSIRSASYYPKNQGAATQTMKGGSFYLSPDGSSLTVTGKTHGAFTVIEASQTGGNSYYGTMQRGTHYGEVSLTLK